MKVLLRGFPKDSDTDWFHLKTYESRDFRFVGGSEWLNLSVGENEATW